jgi:hypothetical protein
VVPEATRLWKPEIAPHAMVMNRNGNQCGEPSGTLATAGATIRSNPIRMPKKITARAIKSWCELM